MTTTGTSGPSPGDHMDDVDLEILGHIREMFRVADPMPAGLPERIRFALACRDVEYEIARMTAEADQQVLAARGGEQSQTITFDSDSLTIMIRVNPGRDGTARVDGWLAPPRQRTIELRTGTDTLVTVADDSGRFAFAQVPSGSAQLVVRAGTGPDGSEPAVLTPALVL